jgi:hypothetical protein
MSSATIAERVLSGESLRLLLEELEHGGDLIAVQPVLAPRETAPEHLSLGDVAELLLGLRLRGVQLRYRIGGRVWCTTIRTSTDGFLMTRQAA